MTASHSESHQEVEPACYPGVPLGQSLAPHLDKGSAADTEEYSRSAQLCMLVGWDWADTGSTVVELVGGVADTLASA
jgi:hypothetical protein